MKIQMGFQPEDFTLRTWRAVAAEFIATGLFVFIGTGSVVVLRATMLDGSNAAFPPGFVMSVAIAHGMPFMFLVAATARISGGHINPAVTFAAAATGKIKVSTAGLYIGGQLIAAILGSLLLKAVIEGPFELGLGAHAINAQLVDGASAGLVIEAVLTFVLVFVIFATLMDPKGLAHVAPMAIGFTVLVGHMAGFPLTGASMNPARSFGPAVVANVWDDHWIYWLGPLIGAAIAALIYEFVFLQREEEDSPVVNNI